MINLVRHCKNKGEPPLIVFLGQQVIVRTVEGAVAGAVGSSLGHNSNKNSNMNRIIMLLIDLILNDCVPD